MTPAQRHPTAIRAALAALALALLVEPAAAQADPDRQPVLAEPDFTLAALPTALRMPIGAFAFRLTHRFARPIAAGTFGDFVADFFGFDASAQIGLELRYGVLPGTQATIYRTNNRAIQLLGQQELRRQSESWPVGADLILSIEGANNFERDFAPAVGVILSHRVADKGAVYLQPLFVYHAGFDDPERADSARNAMVVGLGARWRLAASRTYLLIEAAPRVGAFDPGVHHVTVGIEKRSGGHVFQFNISNSLGTTLRQVARGGPASKDWFVGFNLTRKFY